MGGPYSFNGPVWAIRVPTLMSAAGTAEIKANVSIKTLAKITNFFILPSFILWWTLFGFPTSKVA
jgi:hypothetical protein